MDKSNWTKPLPDHLATPTCWPAMLALGSTLTLLGLVTSLAISAVGLGLSVTALIGWLKELVGRPGTPAGDLQEGFPARRDIQISHGPGGLPREDTAEVSE